jgi:hypothetical protein
MERLIIDQVVLKKFQYIWPSNSTANSINLMIDKLRVILPYHIFIKILSCSQSYSFLYESDDFKNQCLFYDAICKLDKQFNND